MPISRAEKENIGGPRGSMTTRHMQNRQDAANIGKPPKGGIFLNNPNQLAQVEVMQRMFSPQNALQGSYL